MGNDMTTPNTENTREAPAPPPGEDDSVAAENFSLLDWDAKSTARYKVRDGRRAGFLAGIAHARQQPAPPSRERRSKDEEE